jgi:hypothetical protein
MLHGKLRVIAQNRVFKILFLLFLVVPFGLFGVEQYLQRPAGGDTVATVGTQRIAAGELDQAMRRQGRDLPRAVPWQLRPVADGKTPRSSARSSTGW